MFALQGTDPLERRTSGHAAPLPALAQEAADLAALTNAADLVAVGEVTSVDFAMSAPGPDGQRPLPHAFVTYKLDEVLAGRYRQSTLALRFLSEPTSDGLVLKVSHTSTFEPGQRDLLLVEGNDEAICPLVGCEGGRVRLVRGEALAPLDLALGFGGDDPRPVSEAEFVRRVEEVADRGAVREVVTSQPARGGFAPPVFAAVAPPPEAFEPEPEVHEAMESAAEAREQLGEAWK